MEEEEKTPDKGKKEQSVWISPSMFLALKWFVSEIIKLFILL